MQTFLGIGECMVELSAAGPGLWRQNFAGDVFNTLWYARIMLPERWPEHWQVRFFTALGQDPVSEQLIAFAEDAGIVCADVPRIAGRVPGLYAIHLNEGERSFSYWRDTSAARLMMQDQSHLEAAMAQADLIYLSGITLAILPPEDAASLIRLLGDARQAGKRVAFDPNIRPRLWDNPDRMRATLLAGAGVADILLPSFDDETMAFGDADPEATARRYAALGCGHVVVKNGGKPTTLLLDGRFQTFEVAPLSQIVDTTAAGDSFNGVYLARYLQTANCADAIRAAQDIAANVVRTRGALVPKDSLSAFRHREEPGS